MTFSELDVDIKLYVIREKEEINNSAKEKIFEIAQSDIQTKVGTDTDTKKGYVKIENTV